MASFLAFLIFCSFRAVSAADPQTSSFSFTRFDQDPYFHSNIALSGDSRVINGGSAIQLTGSMNPSPGRTMYKKPIKIAQGNPPNSASFSVHLSFSLSLGHGNGIVFVMAPISANVTARSQFGVVGDLGFAALDDAVLVVEFDTVNEVKYDHAIDRVGEYLGCFISVSISNVSSSNLVSSYTGQKIDCWIDYEAGSRRLEVRSSRIGRDPVFSHQLDLWKMWGDGDVVMGLSSSSRNLVSNWSCFIYSWSFGLRKIPRWMHSQPLDPNAVSEVKNPTVREKSDGLLKVLAMMIFGTASGALGLVLVFYICAMFVSRRHPVVPEGFVMTPLHCEYKKVEVVVVVDASAAEDHFWRDDKAP